MNLSAVVDGRPLVLHVVYRFDTGGLENGIVNLINHMPGTAYRHTVVALTEVVPAFSRRIQRNDVTYVSLHKPPGHGLWMYPRLVRLFRQMKPAIVHTRNLAALECQVPAWFAGVPVRIHGEHGRDVGDLDGTSRKYRWLRRCYRPFVHHYIALSRDLAAYLSQWVGLPASRVTLACNGVDTKRFHPAAPGPQAIAGCPFAAPAHWLVGTVGRMQTVKNQVLLARAFVRVFEIAPELRERLRLVMVGDGPLRAEAEAVLCAAGAENLAWLPGERDDVPEVMRGLDCFVLPSLAEGISNTILEAMACGLPVIATDVGGNAELVRHDVTGEIVRVADVEALAASLVRLARDPGRAASMGRAGRADAEQKFSMEAMVDIYKGVYDRQLGALRTRRA